MWGKGRNGEGCERQRYKNHSNGVLPMSVTCPIEASSSADSQLDALNVLKRSEGNHSQSQHWRSLSSGCSASVHSHGSIALRSPIGMSECSLSRELLPRFGDLGVNHGFGGKRTTADLSLMTRLSLSVLFTAQVRIVQPRCVWTNMTCPTEPTAMWNSDLKPEERLTAMQPAHS